MNFEEWLLQNEAKGAFGKQMQMPSLSSRNFTSNNNNSRGQIVQRDDNRFLRFDQRVQYGKSIEQQIFSSLVKCGLKLKEPSSKEDMYDKIDGWWTTPQGQMPIQIKYRDTGDDILFEVMKDYEQGVPGRDMIGKAVYYAVLNRSRTIVMVSVAEAKMLIKKARDLADAQGFDHQGNFAWGNVSLKLRPDPSTGQTKMMAYIPVHALKQVITPCNAQINY